MQLFKVNSSTCFVYEAVMLNYRVGSVAIALSGSLQQSCCWIGLQKLQRKYTDNGNYLNYLL